MKVVNDQPAGIVMRCNNTYIKPKDSIMYTWADVRKGLKSSRWERTQVEGIAKAQYAHTNGE